MARFIHPDGSITPDFPDSQTPYYERKGFVVYDEFATVTAEKPKRGRGKKDQEPVVVEDLPGDPGAEDDEPVADEAPSTADEE